MIKHVLDALTKEERAQLMVAFEGEFAQFVELPEGRFIGVNVDSIKHLKPIERAGVWAYGQIKGQDER